MISEIKGDVIAKNKESNYYGRRMGFEVNVAPGLLDSLGFNEEVHLHTRLLLRDDGLHLYGFKNLEERALFDMLLKVQGIGPKTALGVLAPFQFRILQGCFVPRRAYSHQNSWDWEKNSR